MKHYLVSVLLFSQYYKYINKHAMLASHVFPQAVVSSVASLLKYFGWSDGRLSILSPGCLSSRRSPHYWSIPVSRRYFDLLLLIHLIFWNICFAVRVTAVQAFNGIFCGYESSHSSVCRLCVFATSPSWHTLNSAYFFSSCFQDKKNEYHFEVVFKDAPRGVDWSWPV